MAYCTECGAPLEDGAKFCGRCGMGVDPVQADGSAEDAALKAGAQQGAVSAVGELAGKATQVMANVVDVPDVAGEFVVGTWSADPIPFAGGAAGQVVQAVQGALLQGGQIAQQARQATQAANEAMPQEVQSTQPMPAQAQPQVQSQAAQPTSGNQTEQFKSHRPTGRYASSDGGSKPAAEKKKSKLPIVAIGAGAVLIIAALMLYVVPLFQFQPHDPNEGKPLTSESASASSASASSGAASSSVAASTSTSSASASASSAAASASASSAAASASSASASASAESASGGSATSEPSGGATPASSEAIPPAGSTSYSTIELPTISDFKWMTGETDKGNAPAGVARITDFGTVMGGWKAYMYGGNLERLLNVNIDAGQSGAAVTLDWYYIRDNKQDKVFEDTTASSTFTGTFDGGMLDATGSGRITLTAFWEQDGHQYATGSFMWPSGETEVIALVRP